MKFTILSVLFLVLITNTFCKSKKESPSVKTVSTQTKVSTDEKPQSPAIGLNLGNAAPEISLKNTSGKEIKLSSLRGKVVLIDFWASWCSPCRQENPTLVKAYIRYKDKKLKGGNGFTIYSVSLDANGALWENAIEKDSLIWEFHVSDLNGWGNEAASRYGVSAIPMNFLINENGVILNKNLRGEILLQQLEKLSQ